MSRRRRNRTLPLIGQLAFPDFDLYLSEPLEPPPQEDSCGLPESPKIETAERPLKRSAGFAPTSLAKKGSVNVGHSKSTWEK
jgi:hypothetical protein